MDGRGGGKQTTFYGGCEDGAEYQMVVRSGKDASDSLKHVCGKRSRLVGEGSYGFKLLPWLLL